MLTIMSYQMERRKSCGSCLRYCMIVVNLLFALLGAGVVATFIYFHITQVDFVTAVLGTDMVVAASLLVIIAGALLLALAIYGVIISIVDKVKPIPVYIVFIVITFCTMAAGVICALVFKTWLTEQVRHQMESTLMEVYGISLDDPWNRKVTDSWDKAQTLWRCCAVDDQSWDVYQRSEWYKNQPGTPGNPRNPKPYVPRSCCVLDASGQISESNLLKCQTNSDGPPARRQGSQYAGTYNAALHYRGCYEAAQDYLINDRVSWFGVLVGVGSAVAILMLLGIILSIAFYVTKKRELKSESYMAEYSKNNSRSVLF